MICCNPIHQVCDYAALALYCSPPDLEQIRNGVVPLDSLPAAWWNWMWNDTNKAVNEARSAVGVLIDEVQSVLSNAGVCLNPSCVDQLYQAIDKIRQRIGNATTAGAVKSSSTPGMVSIDDNGLMTANCLGNAANLTTTARTVVGAVNELKQTYDCCFTDVNTCLGTLETGRAPIMHASTSNCYGVGSAACYGHVKLSDTYCSCVGGLAQGVAASQKALYDAYTTLEACLGAQLGSTNGCALGTAAAGSATTAARSDHVHPAISVYCGTTCKCGIGSTALCLGSNAFNSTAFTTCKGTVTVGNSTSTTAIPVALCTGATAIGKSSCCALTFIPTTGVLNAAKFCGSFCGVATRAGYATCLYNRPGSTASATCNVFFYTGKTDANCAATNYASCICGANGYYYGNVCGTASCAIKATCASKDGSGCSFGSAARYACTCFRPATWTPTCVECAGTAYEVFDKYGSGTKIGIGYAQAGLTCAQLTHFAAFSTNYASGCTVIKDASIGVAQQALGLASAAYCSASCFLPASTTCVACSGYANCAGIIEKRFLGIYYDESSCCYPVCVYKTQDSYAFQWGSANKSLRLDWIIDFFLCNACYTTAINTSSVHCEVNGCWGKIYPASGYSWGELGGRGTCSIQGVYTKPGTNSVGSKCYIWYFPSISWPSSCCMHEVHGEGVPLPYINVIHNYTTPLGGCICIPILEGADKCPNI